MTSGRECLMSLPSDRQSSTNIPQKLHTQTDRDTQSHHINATFNHHQFHIKVSPTAGAADATKYQTAPLAMPSTTATEEIISMICAAWSLRHDIFPSRLLCCCHCCCCCCCCYRGSVVSACMHFSSSVSVPVASCQLPVASRHSSIANQSLNQSVSQSVSQFVWHGLYKIFALLNDRRVHFKTQTQTLYFLCKLLDALASFMALQLISW